MLSPWVCLSVDVLYTFQGRSLTLGVVYNKLGGGWMSDTIWRWTLIIIYSWFVTINSDSRCSRASSGYYYCCLCFCCYHRCHTAAPRRPGSRWQVYFIIWSGGFIYRSTLPSCPGIAERQLKRNYLIWVSCWLVMISHGVAVVGLRHVCYHNIVGVCIEAKENQ